MRIRTDSVFISSVLFTIAFLCLVPFFWTNVLTAGDRIWLGNQDADLRAAAETMSNLSVACLATILIGLIVVWAGYIKRLRWVWAVMFVVVWVWAFPLLVLPLFKGRIGVSFAEWVYDAICEPGSSRIWLESVLVFALMVIALVLPTRSFFLMSEKQEPMRHLSHRLVGTSIVGVFILMTVLFGWIRLGVIYEIPPTELNSTQRLPPPVAPTP